MDLFATEEQEKTFEVFPLEDGEILFMRNFFTPSEAKYYFDLLQSNINWKQEEVKFYSYKSKMFRLYFIRFFYSFGFKVPM